MADIEQEIKRLQENRAAGGGDDDVVEEGDRIGLMSKGGFDSEIYGNQTSAFSTEVMDDEMVDDDAGANHPSTRASINADRRILDQGTDADSGADPFAAYREESGMVNTRISDRETDYQKKRMNRIISPARGDAFSGKTPARSYKDIMLEQNLQREEAQVLRAIEKKKEVRCDLCHSFPVAALEFRIFFVGTDA
jgi:splicing factor 3B subunit 1